MGGRPNFFKDKGWAKRKFHYDWGWVIDLIGQFQIVQQQKNRVEVQGNNLHFPLF